MAWRLSARSNSTLPAACLDPLLAELSTDLQVTRRILLAAFGIGITTVFIMWILHVVSNGFTAFFWALACFACGSLVGFLFGIPKVLQRENMLSETAKAAAQDGINASQLGYHLVVNTHLDDISDWLTKIAVGVGLVELEKIPGMLHQVAVVIASGIAPPQQAAALVPFGVALLLYFTCAGFMSGYLTTRMFFQRAFRVADLHATGLDQDKNEENSAINASRVDGTALARAINLPEAIAKQQP